MLCISRVPLLISIALLTLVAPQKFNFSNCGIWEQLKLQVNCKTAINKYLDYGNNHTYSTVDLGQVKLLSDNVTTCLADINCTETENFKAHIDSTLELYIFSNSDNKMCLKGFFKKAYTSQFTKNESCFRNFSLLHQNSTKIHDAFTDSKLCFLKYVKDYCTPASTDQFSSENYKQFVEYMSSPNHECKGPKKILDEVKCNVISEEYNERRLDYNQIVEEYNSKMHQYKAGELNEIPKKSHREFVMEYIHICRDVVVCKANNCLYPNQEQERLKFERWCDIVEKYNV